MPYVTHLRFQGFADDKEEQIKLGELKVLRIYEERYLGAFSLTDGSFMQ